MIMIACISLPVAVFAMSIFNIAMIIIKFVRNVTMRTGPARGRAGDNIVRATILRYVYFITQYCTGRKLTGTQIPVP